MPEIEQVEPGAEAISANLALEQLISRCINDPLLFVTAVLRKSPRPWQRKALNRIKEVLSDQSRKARVVKLLIRTCHGAGKSELASWLPVWLCATRPDSRCLTTAPTWAAVENVLWPYINRAWKGSMLAEIGFGRCLTTQLSFGDGWYAIGAASDRPENLEGHHSNVAAMRIVDEAKAVPENVFTATNGMLDAPENWDVWISTPSIRDGTFYNRDVKNARDEDGVIRIKVSNEDLIRDAEEEGDHAFAEQRRAWGREELEKYGSIEDPEYQTRVMAEYADFDANALFPFSWITRAMDEKPWPDFDYKQPPVMGVDCAGSVNGDATVAVNTYGPDSKGRYVVKLSGKWRQADTMVTKGNLVAKAMESKPFRVRVDTAGLGKGIFDALRHDPNVKRVESFMTQRPAGDKIRFKNRKTEVAFLFRRLLEDDKVRLYKSDDLKSDLVRARVDVLPSGQRRLLDPDVADQNGKKAEEGTRSPDDLDAVLISLSNGPAYEPTVEERAEELVECKMPESFRDEEHRDRVVMTRYFQYKAALQKVKKRQNGITYARRIA